MKKFIFLIVILFINITSVSIAFAKVNVETITGYKNVNTEELTVTPRKVSENDIFLYILVIGQWLILSSALGMIVFDFARDKIKK